MTTKPFVLIVEDHPLFKQALSGLLRLGFPDRDVDSAADAQEAFAFLETRKNALEQSVMLLDPGLPDISLPELMAQLSTSFSTLPTIVISGSDDPLVVSLCLGAGVKAFVSKLVAPDRIVDLVGRTLRGETDGQMWLTVN
ncbi:MAG: DNA-binding response regulator, partial [Bacteroidetes bacterium]|nr:DNA-binding response regulator [Bacteroidota bacterium]